MTSDGAGGGDARLSRDMVGSSSPSIEVAWDARDAMLYALGVGAGLGAPTRELQFTTENSEGITLRAVPSFLTVLLVPRLPPVIERLDKAPFLHAEQHIELARPLAPCGRGLVRTCVESVFDKGRDGIVVVRAELRDAKDGELIGLSRASMFVRGGGGFGGERGTSSQWRSPEREPDIRIRHQTRPEQALIYRLSGDRHPLHSDPVFARRLGFEAPILHGLAAYGFACRAVVEGVCAGDPGRLRSLAGRFTRPVVPGETLTTEIWRNGAAPAAFRTLDSSGRVVIDRGEARAG
jgi:acyl dehydratase